MTTAGIVSLVILASSAALAQDEDDYSREGPYLGFDAVLAVDNSNSALNVSETGGLAGRLGFRLTREFALELEGEWTSLDGRNPWSISIGAKLYPIAMLDEERVGFLDDRLQPYVVTSTGIIVGKLGRGHEPGASFRFGAGADYWLSNDLALTGQVVYALNAGDAAYYDSANFRLGVTWRF